MRIKSHRKLEGDTAKEFLEQLAADKGAILTDEEYDSVRSSQLQTLARPPRIEWAVAGPGLLCICIGVGLLVAALLTWITAPEDTTMNRLMTGLLLIGLGSYFFFGNLHACRAAFRRPYNGRISEIDGLLRSGLITSPEHEIIKQAIEHECAIKVQSADTKQKDCKA
jgi:hypothetical protein